MNKRPHIVARSYCSVSEPSRTQRQTLGVPGNRKQKLLREPRKKEYDEPGNRQ